MPHIDALKAEQSRLLVEAEQMDSEGKRLARSGNADDVQHGGHLRNKSEKNRRAIDRAETKLLKLKNALAEMRTDLLFGNKLDRQVVLKPLSLKRTICKP